MVPKNMVCSCFGCDVFRMTVCWMTQQTS